MVNRVTHVKRTFIDPRFMYVKQRTLKHVFRKTYIYQNVR